MQGEWVMSTEEVDRHQALALLAVEKAKQRLNLLLAEAKQISNRHAHIARLMRDLEASDNFLSGPAVDLLKISEMEYGDTQNLTAIKALANSVILAKKQFAEATQKARDLGVGG